MKINTTQHTSRLLRHLTAGALALGLTATAHAQGTTAFTYQGRLTDGVNPATGIYDLSFTLYDSAGGTGTVGSPVPKLGVGITNGLFTVALDFGAAPFNGQACWLEIAVTATGSGPVTTLTPRQPLTPTPYALHAQESSGLDGLRIQASTNGGPSVIGGSSLNSVAPNVAGATIAGGGAVNFGGLGVNYSNTVTAAFGTVGGGGANQSSGAFATVAGGGHNTSSGSAATVAGGDSNLASGNNAAVGGGAYNTNAAFAAVIGGGGFNSIALGADYGVIPGGNHNSVTAAGGFAAGRDAHANHTGSFVWGDGSRTLNSSVSNQFDVLAMGGASFYTGSGSLMGVEGSGTPAVPSSTGIYGVSYDNGGNGVVGEATNGGSAYAIWGKTTSGYAGYFDGKIQVNGNATITGNTTIGGTTTLGTLVSGTTTMSTLNLPSPAVVNFGNGLRQMLNLYNTDYGIGIQNNAQYSRSASDFYWFKGGSHSDATGEAGTGGTSVMHLDSTGTLFVKVLTITGGSDVAEPFKMASQEIAKGAVVIIDQDHPGQLKLSERAYDTRVAGIVSGANGIKPGLSLHQEGTLEGDQNVALSGRVYVQADASHGAIEPGDLLTTSDLPGYAMKVTDHAKAQGAILGKAMTSLDQGTGLVLVLVTLQ